MNNRFINIKFIAVHILPAFLMLLGGRELYLLFDPRFIEVSYLPEVTEKAIKNIFIGENENLGIIISNFIFGLFWTGLAGFSTSVVLSWAIARKQIIHWSNFALIEVFGIISSVMATKERFNFHQIPNSFIDLFRLIGIRPILFFYSILLIITAIYLLLRINNKKHYYQHGV